MREILFRGKHMHVCPENKHLDGTWVEGYLEDENHINDGKCEFLIDPETICQYTGLTDKNGKKIWENDILHNGNYFVVKWNAHCARFDIVLNNLYNIPIGKWEPMICDWKNNDFKEYRKAVDYEVIGNIFDNPELLEVYDGEQRK